MSELINTDDNRTTIRWKLLTGASVLALTVYVSSASLARAEDSDRPLIWIELGGQLSRLQDNQEIFAPPFVALTPPGFTPPQNAERPPRYGFDESGKISFQPDNSDWVFSAAIRYGRASSGKHVRHQSYPTEPYVAVTRFYKNRNGHVFNATNFKYHDPIAARFTDATVKQSESFTVLDFHAGKDLGLGLFGANSSSTLNMGVRIAQFRSKSQIALKEDPDWQFKTRLSTFGFSYSYYGSFYIFRRTAQDVYQPYHTYSGSLRAKRSFSGVGPSISWNSSVPFAGNPQDGGLSIDWGVNAALLFGRQKTKVQHGTMGSYHHASTYRHSAASNRTRSVVVPNIGGFAGISFNYADAKVSLGYRGDFFFGAIDGGIDAAKKENRGFYGPYASISIGLGD